MMEETRLINDEMLVKYLLGEASESEKQAVQQWLNAGESNRDYFARFRLIWNESTTLPATSDVDTDAAWLRFWQRTQQEQAKTARPFPYKRAGIAAALVLLIAGGWLAYVTMVSNNTPKMAVVPDRTPVNQTLPRNGMTVEPVNVNDNDAKVAVSKTAATYEAEKPAKMPVHHKAIVMKRKPRFINTTYKDGLFRYDRTKDFICNNTPCPIEICIIQTMKCPNGQPTAVSTCSILEPDESGQLRYKAFDKITHNCMATVDEIRIKRVSTGETIVLNAESKPATAQEFFNYITGQKKGDVFAGMFHTDCDNNKDECGLIFNNSNLNLQ